MKSWRRVIGAARVRVSIFPAKVLAEAKRRSVKVADFVWDDCGADMVEGVGKGGLYGRSGG